MWEWIKKKFFRWKKKGIVLAIVVGHNHRAQGAINYLGESEYRFNSRVARLLKKELKRFKLEAIVIHRSYSSYPKQCLEAAIEMTKRKVTHSLHLHFNASGTKALGAECLVDGSANSEEFLMGDVITDLLNERYGFKERHDDGVKVIDANHNGWKMLNACKMRGVKSCLVEPCFGDWNNPEADFIFNNEHKYVELLRDSILKFNKLRKRIKK